MAQTGAKRYFKIFQMKIYFTFINFITLLFSGSFVVSNGHKRKSNRFQTRGIFF